MALPHSLVANGNDSTNCGYRGISTLSALAGIAAGHDAMRKGK